jgi:hypothetical protein
MLLGLYLVSRYRQSGSFAVYSEKATTLQMEVKGLGMQELKVNI